MKSVHLIIAFSLFAFHANAQDINGVAKQYIDYFSKGELQRASELMACPDSYSEEQIKKDRKANLESLKIFEKELGEVLEFSISDTNTYITAMTACGNIGFLRTNHPFRNIVYEVKYQTNKTGYIVLGFSGVTSEAKLVTVNHGLSALDPGSKEKIENIINKLTAK